MNSISNESTYKVKGKQLMQLDIALGGLFRDIGYWRNALHEAFANVNDEPTSATQFVARVATVALNIDRDLKDLAISNLRKMPFEMAAEEIDDPGQDAGAEG